MSTNPFSQLLGSLAGTVERRVAAVAIVAALAAGALGLRSWMDERDQRQQMTAAIASQNSIIAAAAKREEDRAEQLADTLKQIAALKSSVQTPQQVIREIPQYLPQLPQPLETIPSSAPAKPPASSAGAGTAAQKSAGDLPAAPDVRVPSADLKPLFDYVQNCRACQAQLAAVQQDVQDERAKNAALTKQRDEALNAAKGGSVWHRTLRVVKWVAIGFGIGFVAHAAMH